MVNGQIQPDSKCKAELTSRETHHHSFENILEVLELGITPAVLGSEE